jgi:hypothetical protein
MSPRPTCHTPVVCSANQPQLPSTPHHSTGIAPRLPPSSFFNKRVPALLSTSHRIVMAAATVAPDPVAPAALPAIALALRHGDASAREAAAVQLRHIVTKAPADAQAVCVAVAGHSDVVDAAFVQALGRPGLSEAAQHALVTAMMTMMSYDGVKEACTAMMQASPVYMPVLLRIIAQEQPVSACRYNTPPPTPSRLPLPPSITSHHTVFTFACFFAVLKPFDQFFVSYSGNTPRPTSQSFPWAFRVRLFALSTATQTRTTELAP